MTPDFPILIIDDNEAICTALQVLLDIHDIPSLTANSPAAGLKLARAQVLGAVIQDMNFEEDHTSGEEGVRLFRELRKIDPGLPVLLITAWTSLEAAVKLVKEGAQDYLGKPWDDARLVEEVRRLRASRSFPAAATASSSHENANLCGLKYADPSMHALVETSLKIAPSDAAVLITGPNGAGKEMLAQIIQANSKRRHGPFVKVNAGGLPHELLESELFGAEAGAFTGATRLRVGRFEEAHGGTLFLDEIGNLPLPGQMKLLRVLQSGELSRLGSNRIIKVDVRVISATNIDLQQAIARGSFREDLYFRLNVMELALPPLVRRPADIPLLADYFLKELKDHQERHLSAESQKALLGHGWPGNVRELRNRIQRAALVCSGSAITPQDLGLTEVSGPAPVSLVEDPEARRIRQALKVADGNISQAATALDMSRQALYRRMEKHGIVWERRPLD